MSLFLPDHIGPFLVELQVNPVRTAQALQLSAAQSAVWIAQTLDPESPIFNVGEYVEICGPLDSRLFAAALRQVVNETDALRLRVIPGNEGAEQCFDEYQSWEPVMLDFSSEVDPLSAAESWMREDLSRPVQLEREPLFCYALLQLAKEHFLWFVRYHHIAMDGFGAALISKRVAEIYSGLVCHNQITSSSFLPISELLDQESEYRSKQVHADRQYWLGIMGNYPEVATLSAQAPAPSRSFIRHRASVPAPLLDLLADAGRRCGTTLAQVFEAATAVYVHRLTGADDVVLGATLTARVGRKMRSIPAMTSNILPLRVNFSTEMTFADLLRQLKTRKAEMIRHQRYRMEELRADLGLQPSDPDLYGTLINVMSFDYDLRFGECTSTTHNLSNGPVNDLSIVLYDRQDSSPSRLDLDANPAHYTQEELASHQQRFIALLEQLGSVDCLISEFRLLSGVEERTVVFDFNNTAHPLPESTLPELFEAQVARTPQTTALIVGEAALSYHELNARANRLAHHLVRRGLGPESIVGICLARSGEMLVALLAILKSGAGYLPLDPEYPRARLAAVLEDAQPACVVTTSELSALLPQSTKAVLVDSAEVSSTLSGLSASNLTDKQRSAPLLPQHSAYLIYTSGSTGKPKGVVIEHRSASAFIAWCSTAFTADEWAGVLASTSICFDLSVFELFATLSYGGTVLLASSIMDLPQLPARDRVRLINTVPSAAQSLLDSGSLRREIRTVNLAGEALPRALVENLYQRGNVRRVLNLYGPSEATTYSTFCPCRSEEHGEPVIGKPISNTRAYVLDQYLRPVPVGIRGELYLSGCGLARGYLNRPDLTAERFVADPFAEGERMYRTGDLARWRADGSLEFLGRIDHQVKVRGFRVEPGEIEAIIKEHSAIRQALVIARDKQLVAYVVATQSDRIDSGDLQSKLAERLPRHMVPSAIVSLSSLPLTPNGKIDRRALPAPEWLGHSNSAPRTPPEEELAHFFCEVLSRERVGIHDNFFDLGGHSLMAMRVLGRVRSTFGIDVTSRAFFDAPTVAALASQLSAHSIPEPLPPIEPRPQQMPASHSQQRLWFIDKLQGSTHFHIPEALRLRGHLDAIAMERAINAVVARHESLRTHFIEVNGAPIQVISSEVSVPLSSVDLSGLNEAEKQKELDDALRAEWEHPFDLSHGPLFRVKLLKFSAAEHILLLTFHHIVFDGWSLEIFYRELSTLYQCFRRDQQPELPSLPLQFADHVLSQDESKRREDLEYWTGQLTDIPEQLELPRDRPRPLRQTFSGSVLHTTLLQQQQTQLESFARAAGCTTYMVLLAGFGILLHRYSGQDDLVIGSPVANRHDPRLEQVIGYFSSAVVMRLQIASRMTVSDLLDQIRATSLDAYRHQDVPFEELATAISSHRNPNFPPVFQVMLAFQNNPASSRALEGLEVEVLDDPEPRARFDLEIYAWEREERLDLYWVYNRDLFDGWRIEQMAAHYSRLLQVMVAGANTSVHSLEMISAAERQQILSNWNQSAVEYPRERLVQNLFEEQAAKAPHLVAAETSKEKITYGELNLRANQVAHHLVELGVRPDDRVGVCLERGCELLIALFGVLKAGAAYVPLDPAYPEDRLRYMLEDSEARIVISHSSLLSVLPTHRTVFAIDEEWPQIAQHPASPLLAGAREQNLAYVIYTSGSTGLPKGVAVEHQQVCNQLFWAGAELRLGADDCVLQKASFSFDASILEIFLPLSFGARIAVAEPGGERDVDCLLQFAIEKRVTYVDLAPSLLDALLDHPLIGEWKSLRIMSSGAEALKPETVRQFYKVLEAELWNTYGPTETTVQSTFIRVTPDSQVVPIGRAVANTRLFVLDRHLEPVALSVAGELYIAGEGVARAYWKRPGLTAEKFIPDPFSPSPGNRMYSTGDLVRWSPAGNLEFLGRADHQVKIRGFRIELGEIETALRAHPAVSDAIVTIHERGAVKQLCAYVVSGNTDSSLTEDLQKHLGSRLPEYMVPAVISVLSAWPLTPSGKIDRRSLPSPHQQTNQQQVPRTGEEEVLCAVYADVLGVERVGIRDNFFELGGHSLLAARLVSRVRAALGKELSIRTLFEAPTVAELMERLQENQRPRPELRKYERPARQRLSYAQQRLWFLYRMEGASATYNIPLALRLQGELNEAALEAALNDVVQRHEALRTVFPEEEGVPYQKVLNGEEARVQLRLEKVDEGDLSGRLAEAAGVEMELERELPLRAWLFEITEQEHVLLLVLHHIAGDGWSLAPLARDVGEAYGARREGREPQLTPLSIQYGDYTEWQREVLGEEEDSASPMNQQLEHWKKALEGMPEEIELPVDRARPQAMSYRGGTVELKLDAELHRGLKRLAGETGASLFMVLQAGLAALLKKLGVGEDIGIGTVVAGRSERELEELVGFFVNTLVLRTDVSRDPSFVEVIERVRKFDLEAYGKEELPFERLVEALQPVRSQARHPLVQVMLVLQNAPAARLELQDLTFEQCAVATQHSQFDLALTISECFDAEGNPAGLSCVWEYSSDLFDRETVSRFSSGFDHILKQAAANPKTHVDELKVAGESDYLSAKQQLDRAAAQQRASAVNPPRVQSRSRVTATKRLPRTPREQLLCRLFAELLSLEQVGANENFFFLGGDSILSIQLVSRARKAGLLLTPRDVFQHQTPEQLALAAKTQAPAPQLTPSIDEIGEILPTPVMRALFEQGGTFKTFHQSVRLQVPEALEQRKLTALLQSLIDTHACLRLRLESNRQLRIGARGSVRAEDCLTIAPAASTPQQISAAANQAKESLDPQAGKMLRAVWFVQQRRLLLMIHHLAVDGVSWRILLSDLSAGWAMLSAGKPAVLEPVSTAFGSWTQHLMQRAQQESILTEIEHWERTAAGADLIPGAQLNQDQDCIVNSGALRLTLPVLLTEALLSAVPAAFYAQINDVLLTALALAVLRWRRDHASVAESSIVIDLEGHGREQMDSGMDLSRTVGWFTTVFPVRLDLQQIDLDEAFAGQFATGRALKMIKEQLRAIPANGLDYGLLRYWSPRISKRISALPHPQIAFNYLGRFSAQDGTEWQPVGDDAGFSGGADSAMPLSYLLEIDAIVSDASDGPRLTANFAWAENHLNESDIAALADYWKKALEAIVDHTSKRLATGHSPSDFPLANLSLEQVVQIEIAHPGTADILPVSPLQEGLLFHSLYAGTSDVYTVQTNIEFTGPLISGKLRRAIEILLQRHANLRVSIDHEVSDTPLQIIPDTVVLPWREYDFSSLSPEVREQRCSQIISEERAEPFKFSSGPLIRIALIRLASDRHLLVFTNHHIIIDGWSTPLLVSEMLTLYDNGLDRYALAPARPYADYLVWLRKQDRVAGLSLWRDYLADLESPTILDQHSPIAEGVRIPQSWQVDLSLELTESLQGKVRSCGLTLNAFLQGLWAVLLARRTNQKDIVFGITVSGRNADVAGIEEMIGMFVNTVPLRVRLAAGESFLTALANLQKRQSEMLNAYHLGLSEIQREVGFERLFDTLFVFENYPIDPSILKRTYAGIRIGKVEMLDGAHYPMSLMVAPGERLHVRVDYDPARFSREQAEVIGEQFVRLLRSAVEHFEVSWHDLQLLSNEEREQILQEFNNTSRDLTCLTAAQIFERQAALTPDLDAVVQGVRALTYRELNCEANQLADYLRKQGIGPESLVGIALERSPEMIIAVVATWKAGGAYLPLDPEYPRARLEHMINDARPAIVLADSRSLPSLPAGATRVVYLDAAVMRAELEQCSAGDHKLSLSPDHAAYVIYTSGSTGIPKGVVVTHRGLAPLASTQFQRLELAPGCRVLQFASLNFDASFWEILMAFSSGATLVLTSDEREGASLYNMLLSQQVTHALLPIPVLRTLDEFDRLPVRVLMNGGEALTADLVARWSPGLKMINAYGPTESTVCATISDALSGTHNPTIGSPILNTRVYILDGNLQPAPVGVAGELYIAGDGLARGYLNRPSLTSSRFVADAYGQVAGSRMYRTGDLARWREDGNLEFLGRTDEQVKVRGFRIELGEIETALRFQPEIVDAAAVVHENQSSVTQIAAYLVPSNGSIPDSVVLRQRLSEHLPVYMLPAVFITVEALPRNPNGKLNRRMLPRIDHQSKNTRPAESKEEIAISAMFAEVLGIDSVAVEDDFFALGGDSLGAMRLVSRIANNLKVPLSLRDFYSASTVEALARLVQAMQFTSMRDGAPSVEAELLEEEEI